MSDTTRELYEAATALLPFLEASTDRIDLDQLIPLGETPAQRLRRKADELEAKDAAIQRFRAAVAAFEPPDDHAGLLKEHRLDDERS